TPLPSCKHVLSAGDSKLSILVSTDKPSANKILWKWKKGQALTNAEAGNPVADSTHYSFCIYDADQNLLYETDLPPGANWSAKGTKRTYKDKTFGQQGVKGVKVYVGSEGKSSAA